MDARKLLLTLLILVPFTACNTSGIDPVDSPGGGGDDTSYAFDAGGGDGPGSGDDAPSFGDGGAEDTLPDGNGPDLFVTPDGSPPGCEVGTGCPGDPCSENADCISGLCIAHMGDFICAQLCDEECPPGFTCKQVATGGPDVVFACVSDFSHLCLPCAGKSDCSDGYQQNACVEFGEDGSFCGASCADGGACPEGFECGEAQTTKGGLSMQCLPAADSLCLCSETASDLGLSTPCGVTNELGTCWGDRACGPGGLGDCDAATPAPEVCDGIDDDCDGVVDEETCDDGNPCTEDTCLGAEGCGHQTVDGGPCDDADPCTFGDHCDAGECLGSAVNCNDGNPCTDDLCDEVFGCLFEPNAGECSDGDPCTFGDHCAAGECVPGAGLACDDGNPCTTDACDEEAGCSYTPQPGPCDDGNPCTALDFCQEGACTGTGGVDCDDDNPCTDDTCQIDTGCIHADNSNPCDDGDICTVGDLCSAGACDPGDAALSCGDGNPCTDDACDPAAGCVFTPNLAACDDGNACTTADHCVGGACVGSGTQTCNDGNPCTDDSCDPATGCIHANNAAGCNDNNACTEDDQCVGGICLGSGALNCNDGNPCTDDSCDPATGCVHVNNAAGCNDGNACTPSDQCSGGTCVGSGALNCNDGNPCTDDSCNPNTGCAHSNNSAGCNDGDPCTTLDVCSGGSCVGSGGLACNDGNPCTSDSCVPGQGCSYSPISPCCGNGAVEPGEQCDDGNQSSGDGCSSSCQNEGGLTFKGYTTFSLDVCTQSTATTDALMEQACKSAYGSAASAATVLDLVDSAISGLSGYNNAGTWVLFKCPFCEGDPGYWNCSGVSTTCRKGVNAGAAWPTSVGSGWNGKMCNNTRTTMCVQ